MPSIRAFVKLLHKLINQVNINEPSSTNREGRGHNDVLALHWMTQYPGIGQAENSREDLSQFWYASDDALIQRVRVIGRVILHLRIQLRLQLQLSGWKCDLKALTEAPGLDGNPT